MEIAKIISENQVRLKELNSPYDPFTGLGSTIPRTKIDFNDIGTLYVPNEMIEASPFTKELCEVKNFKDISKKLRVDIPTMINMFNIDRFKYDFEYWAATTITIINKDTSIPFKFKLRKVQGILLAALEEMRVAGVPIRIVLLKARQWGGSTLVQIYMMWIQQLHKINWNLAVCAQDDGAANNISQLYQRAAELYPAQIGEITFKPYARSPKNIKNVERGGIIGVGSINNPDQFRSYPYYMLHASELGIWNDTPKRTSAQLVQSLKSSIPPNPYTMIVEESTAKGVGTYFHDSYLAAENGESGYKAVFVPFHKIDIYQKPIKDYAKFINEMNAEAWITWKLGGTLEAINWYNNFMRVERYELTQMQEEFPRTPEEAFISTGQRIFPHTYISNARINVKKPVKIGDIYPSIVGKEALKNIEFKESNVGLLKIWKMPVKFVTRDMEGNPGEFEVKRRYVAFADIGGTTAKADFSVIKIIDRYWMMYGGTPETVAVWHGHMDQDLFAWKCAQICTFYNKALLAIEANSLKKEKGDGDFFVTVLDNIALHYDNLFIRNNHESINKDYMPKYGFHTGAGNKDMIITNLLGAFRDDGFREREKEALDECDTFERKSDGTMGAVSGKKDDRVITTAGSYWLATKYVALGHPILVPYVSDTERGSALKKKNIINEATM